MNKKKYSKGTSILLTGLMLLPVAGFGVVQVANSVPVIDAAAAQFTEANSVKIVNGVNGLSEPTQYIMLKEAQEWASTYNFVEYSYEHVDSRGDVIASGDGSGSIFQADGYEYSVGGGPYTINWTAVATNDFGDVLDEVSGVAYVTPTSGNIVASSAAIIDGGGLQLTIEGWDPEANFFANGLAFEFSFFNDEERLFISYKNIYFEHPDEFPTGQIAFSLHDLGLTEEEFRSADSFEVSMRPFYNSEADSSINNGDSRAFDLAHPAVMLDAPYDVYVDYDNKVGVYWSYAWGSNPDDTEFHIDIRDKATGNIMQSVVQSVNNNFRWRAEQDEFVGASGEYTFEIRAVNSNGSSSIAGPVDFTFHRAVEHEVKIENLQLVKDPNGDYFTWDHINPNNDPDFRVGGSPYFEYAYKLFNANGDELDFYDTVENTVPLSEYDVLNLPYGEYEFHVAVNNYSFIGEYTTLRFSIDPEPLTSSEFEDEESSLAAAHAYLSEDIATITSGDFSGESEVFASIVELGAELGWGTPTMNHLDEHAFSFPAPENLVAGQTYTIVYYTANGAHSYAEFTVPATPIIVTLDEATVTQATADAGPSILLPTTDGVDYAITGNILPGHSVALTATAQPGYRLQGLFGSNWLVAQDGLSASQTIVLDEVPEIDLIEVLLGNVIVSQATANEAPTVTPPSTLGVNYTTSGDVVAGGAVTVTATADYGYTLTALLGSPWTISQDGLTATQTIVLDEAPEVPVTEALLGTVIVEEATLTTAPTITLPVTEGVNYVTSGEITAGNTVTITATAEEGYILTALLGSPWALAQDGLTATLTITLADAPEEEPVDPIEAILGTVIVNQATLDAPPSVTLPTTEGIDYLLTGDVRAGGTVTVTATAQDGYFLSLQLLLRALNAPVNMNDWVLADDNLTAMLSITLADAPIPDDNGNGGGNTDNGNNNGDGTTTDGSNQNTSGGGTATTVTTTTTQHSDNAHTTDSNTSVGWIVALGAMIAGAGAMIIGRFKSKGKNQS